MAVTIDLELQAGDVAAEISGIAGALETLDAAADDVDLDFDGLDIDEISGEIGNMVSMLEDIDLDLSSLEEDLDRIEALKDGKIEIGIAEPDGNTGSGDSTGGDPPDRPQKITIDTGDFPDFSETTTSADGGSAGEGLNKQQVGRKIEDVMGFDRGSVSIFGDFDPEELNKIASDIQHTTKNLTSEEYPWVGSDGAENLGTSAMPGNFHDAEDPSEMSWNKLQSRASEAGVYTQDATRDELEGRLQSQQFGGKGITVDTESHGKVGLREARQISQMPDENLVSSDDGQRPVSHKFDTLEDRIRNFREYSIDMVEGFSQAMEKRDEAASPIDTPFKDRGLNFDARMSELTNEELNDLMESPAGDGGSFIGEGDSALVEDIRETRRQAKINTFGGSDETPFGGVNTNLRESTLSGSEMYEAYRDAEGGGERYRDSALNFGGDTERGDTDISTSQKSFRDKVKGFNTKFDDLGKKVRKLRPTMGKYMQLLATLLPIAVALGTQLLGVAAAMGAVAAAGAGIIGLGLLGHGETMADSFAQAKQELQDLKRGLFETFQPAMTEFAPIQTRMFDAIPGSLTGVADELQGLTQFEGTLFNLGDALAGGLEKALQIINENGAAISQLTTEFGGLIGSGLLDFFEWLIRAASRNRRLLTSLGKDMLMLATAAYNVSMAIAKIATTFSPLYEILLFTSQLLESSLVRNLVSLAGWLFIIGKAIGPILMLGGAFMRLYSFIATSTVGMLGYITTTWQAVAATLALASAMSLLTLGTSAIVGSVVGGAAMSGSDIPTGPADAGGGGYGGGTTINDNRTYNLRTNGDTSDYATQKEIESSLTGQKNREMWSEQPKADDVTPDSDGGNK